MLVKLLCKIVGAGGSAFSVQLDDGDLVADLKKAIKAENEDLQCPARNLRLFLAKETDGKWLSSLSEDVKKLKGGIMTPLLEALTEKDLQLQEEDSIAMFLEHMDTPKAQQIHVLVVVSEDSVFLPVKEVDNDAKYKDELTHYQKRGELIQRNCKDYCQQILSKIDALYALSSKFTLPFICVEGSSGMGKTQLAFALGGSRPWFYWPMVMGLTSQPLYGNFSKISEAFREMTSKDDPLNRSEEDILDSMSTYYNTESLWTFGFILALLEYCSSEQNQQKQQGQMIRYQKEALLYVEKCNRKKVVAFCQRMKREGKVLPFFVLDEMTPNINNGGCEKNVAAFQRNVFRVCDLVVVVMGTDAKITNLVNQSAGSFDGKHAWMTIFSRFPPYQLMPLADDDKRTAWNQLQAQYPVLTSIVANSRGRFARFFADSAAQYVMENAANGIELCDLLDVAFCHVSSEIQSGKHFMGKYEGRYAQLMAISYTNVDIDDTSLPPCKKRKMDVGTHCMHLHFANLVDDQATEVDVKNGHLYLNGKSWKPVCCFPDIQEDVLLYLAILGGKSYPGYYDHRMRVDHSTLGIFSENLKVQGFSESENTEAVENNYKKYENMVAHMIFCASRRNGVQGIPFDDFFAGLLSECQDKRRSVTMTLGNTEETIVASDLFDKYAELADLSRSKIPFLAPPNAEWPPYILDTRAEGCNFGHLIRPPNNERCDVYVCNMEDRSKPPLFLCECKHQNKNVGSGMMKKIIKGLEDVWKEKWVVALVFCLKLASFRKDWDHEVVGCVKVNCRSGRVDWVFQPAEEKRKKLVIVMQTGPLRVGVGSKA